jgi:hypothetical protein
MSENKSLLLGIGIIFSAAALLVAGVYAEDRVGFIEHFVHIQLDKEVIEKEIRIAEKKEEYEREVERSANEWAREVESFWTSQGQ